MRKSTILSLALLAGALTFCAPTASAQDDDVTLTYSAYDSGNLTSWGTGRQENYGIAIHLGDPSLAGMVVKAVRVPFGTNTTGLAKGSVFLTKELKVEGRKNVADILVDSFTIANGFVEVTLSKPYTLDAEGVYVGYTFDETELVAAPVGTVDKTEPGSFYVLTSRAYRKWADKSDSFNKASALQVILGNAPVNAASVSFEGLIAGIGDKPQIPMTITNHGAGGVNSIAYTWTFEGNTYKVHQDFTTPLKGRLGASSTLRLTLPELTNTGTLPLTVTIDSVNGQVNEDNSSTCTAEILVYPYVPKKRALLEEYTGTWCGWCPRGFVGLEHMNELYPEDFIGVSYHNGDPMQFTTKYPNDVTGFPAAWLDRVKSTDAYTGDSGGGRFGIDKTWNERNKAFTPLGVEVKAEYTDEAQTRIKAVASVTSPLDMSTADDYVLSYILVANGLTEAGAGTTNPGSWGQSNYFASQAGSWPDDDMKQFTHGSGTVNGLTFNFVVCGWSGSTGMKGSIPAHLTAGVPVEHEYTFNLANAVNSSRRPIYQDKSKMEVVVVLSDAKTGEVLNANKCNVAAFDITGVSALHADEAVTPTDYYTLDGKRLNAPQKGISLVRMSNGETKKIVK